MKAILMGTLAFSLAACCQPSGEGCPDTRTPLEKEWQAKAIKCNPHGATQRQFENCMKRL